MTYRRIGVELAVGSFLTGKRMTLSCPRIVVSRTRDSFGAPLELPPDFVPVEVLLDVLPEAVEVAARPGATPSTVVTLLARRLPGVPEVCCVEDAVAAVVVSVLDSALGRQAIMSTDTISVVEIATLLILGSRN